MEERRSEPLEGLSDEAIVARVLAGDRALFELLMRRNNRRLYRVARAILGRDTEAEDVVQEAYVRAFTHLGAFEGRARFSTWLTRIALYEALACRRRRLAEGAAAAAREEEEELMQWPSRGAADPEQSAAGAELRRVIEASVDALPEHYRVVFMLRAVEELSVAETAECLEIPEETVKTRLHRARGLLRERLLARVEAGAAGAFAFDGARCDRIVAAVLARVAAGTSRGAADSVD